MKDDSPDDPAVKVDSHLAEIADRGKVQDPIRIREQRHDKFSSHSEAWHRNLGTIAFPEQIASPETMEAFWRTCMCNRTRDNKVPGTECADGFEIHMLAALEKKSPRQIIEARRQAELSDLDEKGLIDEKMRIFFRGPDVPGGGYEVHMAQITDEIPFSLDLRPGRKERGETGKDLCDVSAEELKVLPMQPMFLSVSTKTPINRWQMNDNIQFAFLTCRQDEAAHHTFSGANSKWCHNRRFFRSEAGRFGWAIDGAEPRDMIAVFRGCDYPFTLRPNGDGSYKIVGDCYLHGIMDGEAMVNESLSEVEITLV